MEQADHNHGDLPPKKRNLTIGTTMSTAKRARGSTILRVLNILDQVSTRDRPQSATEINHALGLPKATVHRVCNQLEQAGYLQRLDGKRYTPGPQLQTLAIGVLSQSPHRAQRHAILMSLSREIGETCNIAYPDGSQMIYADRVETQWPLRLQLPVGTRVPVHCTASGKLYLSSLPRENRERLIRHLDLSAHTAHTIVEVEALKTELEAVRESGVGIDNEEFVDGMIALAVPIKEARGRFYAAVAFHAPVVRMSLDSAREYIPRLQQAADDLVKVTRFSGA